MSVIKWYRVLYTKSCIFCINFCISCMITSSRCTKTIEPSKYQNTEEIYLCFLVIKKIGIAIVTSLTKKSLVVTKRGAKNKLLMRKQVGII